MNINENIQNKKKMEKIKGEYIQRTCSLSAATHSRLLKLVPIEMCIMVFKHNKTNI